MGKIKSIDSERTIKFTPGIDPHGWIQWKGTDVCIDIHCTCGELSHFDGDFMYYIECPNCGKVYEANSHIELIHVTRDFAMGATFDIKVAD